jgi:hypothetical protein
MTSVVVESLWRPCESLSFMTPAGSARESQVPVKGGERGVKKV